MTDTASAPVPEWTDLVRLMIQELRQAGATDDDIRGVLVGSFVAMYVQSGFTRSDCVAAVEAAWLIATGGSGD